MREKRRIIIYALIPVVTFYLQYFVLKFLYNMISLSPNTMSLFAITRLLVYIILGFLFALEANMRFKKYRKFQLLINIIYLLIGIFVFVKHFLIMSSGTRIFLRNNDLFIFLWFGILFYKTIFISAQRDSK